MGRVSLTASALSPATLRALAMGVLALVGGSLADRAAGEGVRAAAASPIASAASEIAEPWTEQEYRLRERLLLVAGEYLRYGRVDGEARWAPELCRNPNPAMARFSTADDRQGHGQKLYFLFARDRSAYVHLAPAGLGGAKRTSPSLYQIGKKGEPKVIVKESWTPEAHQGATAPDTRRGRFPGSVRDDGLHGVGGAYYPFAQKDGKTYHAAKKAGLFVMLQAQGKLAGDATSDTDDGWLYGAVTADGKTVTAAGKIKSCMECHQQAPHGRLFGLPK